MTFEWHTKSPFLSLQLGKQSLDVAALLALPPQQLPPAGHADWSHPLAALRRCRNREWLRIALRAEHGAPLAETLADLSGFADAAIEAAIVQARSLLTPRYGTPRSEQGSESRLVVLGMGKLGGGELNFSSDIDLICAYTATGHTDGARSISNGEFFVKLVQEMVRLLASATEDGFVFRVDLMLRPFGSASPVAISCEAVEDYYQAHGREWERYALIKARPVAGDLAAGHKLLLVLQPFVFRRYLDFDAITSLRDLKSKIAADALTRGLPGDDLKVGTGGIRECEFIVQSFQLVRGGQDARLRSRSWALTLQALMQQGLIARAVGSELQAAYTLLRRVENAVQIWADAQTHALPEDAERRAWLAAATGFASWDALSAELGVLRGKVANCFNNLFAEAAASQSAPAKAAVSAVLSGSGSTEDCTLALEDAGFGGHAAEVLEAIARLRDAPQLRAATEITVNKLNALLPLLLEDAKAVAERVSTHDASAAFNRSLTVVAAVLGRSTYLTLLRESPQARQNLLALVAASPAITEELARHPVLLDQLLDAHTLYTPPTREQFREELFTQMAALAPDDVEQAMNLLRQELRETRLRIASADAVAGLPLVKVSDALTWLAEAALDAALAFSWRAMVAAHGTPFRADARPARFALIGYGKLGALEMSYGSDLDVVFIHDAGPADADTVGGKRPLPQSAWMARLVQKLLGLLTTQTHLGRAYEVDLELRPNGSAGMPVVSLASFADYLANKAWTWEHQALTRARFVAGDAELGAAFTALRMRTLCIAREASTLSAEIAAMREKMRAHLAKPRAGQWHIKHGAGGLVDVEFLVAHAVLLHAHRHPAVAHFPDVWRQLEALQAAAVMAAPVAEALLNAQRSYRAALHQRNLQGLQAYAPEEEFMEERKAVTAIWQQQFGPA